MPRKTSNIAAQPANQEQVIHPGQYVRDKAMAPAKMSVTRAAELIGISRPNVSNFLNGKATTTPEMATRIERVFKIPAQELLDMQAAYDAAEAKKRGVPANSRAYVPPYLSIKANDIEAWIQANIPARTRLSVLLRTLVHSTGIKLTRVDFPGNDDAERPGWDGFIEAGEGTPWIPEGRSGWEFGTSANIKKKADDDFAKSVKAHDKKDRAEMTFVFVTPRRWHAKKEWEDKARASGQWKDVRAYDADNLEQWLAESLPAQAWFASETNMPADHVRSLDRCWADWANVASPALSGALFTVAIEATKRAVLSRFTKPPERPFIIAADSVEEALAFISQLFSERGGEELAPFRDRVMVFDGPGTLPRLAQGKQTFIPVVWMQEVEKELAPFSASMHCIIVCPRNATTADPSVVLQPLPYEPFRAALREMGKSTDEIARLEKISGRSLTVLRRQLSNVPAIRTPAWAADRNIATNLVPFMLVGTWHSDNPADREALSLIANRPYDDLEKDCRHLIQLNDAPLWSIGSFRGVISKKDLLFAIARFITKEDLKRYFELAHMVLGEDDPKLDLPEEERWFAAVRGKVREFSGAFRKGIAETLVLLAVYGNSLFKEHLGINTEAEASKLVRDLLPSPLTMRKLEVNNNDLPTYAEAAPDTFLSIIEEDLKSPAPAVLGLLKPVNSNVFGSSPGRTGLLWALEGLSWNLATLTRAALILARLSQIEINDNWVNKPMNSLHAIFRAWMPQTSANHEERVALIKKIAERFPEIAWKLCINEFDQQHRMGSYSHKPQWRPDAYGFGEPFQTYGPIWKFQREMADMALDWKNHDLNMICDLVACVDTLDDGRQVRVWDIVKSWAAGNASDADKAVLREKIRVSVLSQRAARRAKKKGKAVTPSQAAQEAYAALEPADLLNRHAWLFRDTWIEESYDELNDEEFDYRKHEQRIAALRIKALGEIFEARGYDGLLSIAARGKAGVQIGGLLSCNLLTEDQLTEMLRKAIAPAFSETGDASSARMLIAGALQYLPLEKRGHIIERVAAVLTEEDAVRFLLLAPFTQSTWKYVDKLGQAAQEKYWAETTPMWVDESEHAEAVERLLKAGRPRAAFSCANFYTEKMDGRLLFRLLSDIAKGGQDQPGHYQLESYQIEKAFERLSANPDLTLEEKAGLEFAYIGALARPWSDLKTHGIPNLERYVEKHPELFVQAVTWVYRRDDEGVDPPEFRTEPDNLKHMAERGYKLLEGLERMPGHNERDELETELLAKWIKTVRDSCKGLARGDIGDICIGKLLSSAPVGSDGVWPCEAVRNVMEDLRSEEVMRGAHTGLYNSRGVHSRGDGGSEERKLADKYRKWADALRFSHPYVSSALLMDMVKTYEDEAGREDTEAGIRQRLR